MDTSCTINRGPYASLDTIIVIGDKTFTRYVPEYTTVRGRYAHDVATGKVAYQTTPCPGKQWAGPKPGSTERHDVAFDNDWEGGLESDLNEYYNDPDEKGRGYLRRGVKCTKCGWAAVASMHGTDPEDLSHFGLCPYWLAENYHLPDSELNRMAGSSQGTTIQLWQDYGWLTSHRGDPLEVDYDLTHDRLPIIENGMVIWPIV
jgi:hypothetical protein